VSGSLQDEVAELLDELARYWSALELRRMPELWDETDPEPIYIAEELRYPVVGWSAFEEYWIRLSGRLRGVSYRTGELRTRVIGPDLALACLVIDWELLPVEAETANRGQSRATAVLRRTPAGWRFIHWMEAPIHLTDDLQE
jgi:hypothetical protein